jgi:hypothetical protein
MSRPKKIKTAIWIGETQWASLRAPADRLDRTAPQLVREAIDLLLKKRQREGRRVFRIPFVRVQMLAISDAQQSNAQRSLFLA